MSFDLKTTVQSNIELSTPEKKLNRLIDQIEHLKRELAAWENAQSEIQTYSCKHFMPVYTELHEVLFKQLEQLWNGLSQYEFNKADTAQLEDKIHALAKMLKTSKLLNFQQLQKVNELYVYYQQTAEYEHNKKSKKKINSNLEYLNVNDTLHDPNKMDKTADRENLQWESSDWSSGRQHPCQTARN